MALVRVVDPGPGPATAATHRCVWGALAATVAWVALHVSGVGHAQAAAVAVGLLTVLPWLGPLLGVLLAAVLAATVQQPFAPLFGLATAAFMTLVGVSAQRLPGWLGPLSIPALAAAVLFGGALAGILGALVAVVTSSALSTLLHRVDHAVAVPDKYRHSGSVPAPPIHDQHGGGAWWGP
ncbi:AI-2E family transporter [Dactylosporangium fulvum]|uniref:AI-2E family transporter n=1 Tax=Dactylosporangium fulvum TaxID=53359 RepID=A0ABY5W0L7_9ACTN|nr:AI-2E family transporter [Dactylosporangium fulvum]UWP83603.1 AI-2E family transporter [Dactylosporangium fulvum]